MTTENKAKNDGRTVTLKKVRLSFTDSINVAAATSTENPERKTHHCNVILETTGPGSKYTAENIAKVQSAIRAACQEKWKNPDRFKMIMEDNPKRVCYRKGEKWRSKKGETYAGYEGNWAFSGSGPNGGQKRPILKDKYKQDVEEKDISRVIYSGTYADVIVSFYGTEKGSDGVFCTIELIRSHQEGTPMAGGFKLEDDWDDELDDFEDDDSSFDEPTSSSAVVEDDPFA